MHCFRLQRIHLTGDQATTINFRAADLSALLIYQDVVSPDQTDDIATALPAYRQQPVSAEHRRETAR